MDMLEIHTAALESSITAYHEFLLYYKKGEKIVYGFVEGRDDPSFYCGLIANQLPTEWDVKLIPSDNKDKVIKVFEGMDWSRYPKKCICFFVDRDLSEFIDGNRYSGENLYVTDNYSIENEAMNIRTMERILGDVFGVIGLNPTEIVPIRNLFESNLKTFSESMAPVMAQILLWKRAGANVSLDNIKPKEIFIFENGRIRLNPNFASPSSRVQHAALCVKAPVAPEHEIANAESEFRSKQGLEKYIRGKYLLWFFVYCAKAIHQAIPSLCTKYGKPPKIHIDLNVKNGITVIAPRVRCPDSLKIFLEHNYCAYIREVAFAE